MNFSKANDNESKLLSVIIPVYNMVPYLKRCVDSVINQTYKNLEIIIINDGSTDNSGAMCDEYKRNDSRVVVIHKQNGGLSDARNAGLDAATGELITFVDSDDWIEHDTYEIAINNQIQTNADIVQFNYIVVRNSEYIKHPSISSKNGTATFSNTEAFSLLLENKEIENYVWNKIYKKELFDGIRFPKGKIFEDVYIAYKLFLKSASVFVNSNEYKYYYFMRKSSIVNTRNYNTDYAEYEAYLFRYYDLQNNQYIDDAKLGKLLCTFYLRYFQLVTRHPFKSKMIQKEYADFFKNNCNVIYKYASNIAHKYFFKFPLFLFCLMHNKITGYFYKHLIRRNNEL